MHGASLLIWDSGGGVVENEDMNQFGPALRWISFEALLAGVRLTEAPQNWTPGKQVVHNSLSFVWRILEYLPIKHPSYQDTTSNTWWCVLSVSNTHDSSMAAYVL